MHRTIGKKHGFSKNYRLSKRNDIDRLFKVGKYQASGFLKFRYLPQTQGYIRVVISVSKRVGNAPKRNRLKRLIRESLRTSAYLRTRSMDCAIYITKPLQKEPTLEVVQRYLSRFLGNLPDEYKTQV
ncbi:MAG: ribonuclease P protein component [Proteobacteria bacterium]|nr:ribonuclease P protein component [Pseudomonadota bacterium]